MLKCKLPVLPAMLLLFSCHSSIQKENKIFWNSPDVPVLTTKYIVTDGKEITIVKHDKDDGAWEFLSKEKIDNFDKVVKFVALKEIVQFDSTVCEVADLREGFSAHREHKGDKWVIEEVK